eukprot:1151011-Amphidinium_carterae.1
MSSLVCRSSTVAAGCAVDAPVKQHVMSSPYANEIHFIALPSGSIKKQELIACHCEPIIVGCTIEAWPSTTRASVTPRAASA